MYYVKDYITSNAMHSKGIFNDDFRIMMGGIYLKFSELSYSHKRYSSAVSL